MNNKKLSLVSTAKEICDITIGNYTLQAFNAWFPLSGIVSIPAGQKKTVDVIVGELFWSDGRYNDAPGECFFNENMSENVVSIDNPNDPNHFYYVVTHKLPPSRTQLDNIVVCPII